MKRIHQKLNPDVVAGPGLELSEGLRHTVVGQDHAVQEIVDRYQLVMSGLYSLSKPAGSFLFLGPSGCGKTMLVEKTAEMLAGAPTVLKINCGEFQHDHEMAKLIGAPPGWVGHRETKPIITKEAVEATMGRGKGRSPVAFILFDEIEKAHFKIFDLLLAVLDKGELRTGDGKMIDLTQAFIFMTSNLGAAEMNKLSRPVGLAPAISGEKLAKKLAETGAEAARKKFSPEFFNRLDCVVTFNSLGQEHLDKVLLRELEEIQQIVYDRLAGDTYMFCVTPAARKELIRLGTDSRYGARPLKRILEKHISRPLANLMMDGRLAHGVLVEVSFKDDRFQYHKTRERMNLQEVKVMHELIYQKALAAPTPRQVMKTIASKAA